METIKVSTVVEAPREEVFNLLMDFQGYPQYTDYVENVNINGNGRVGTVYDIKFSWWKIGYVARSEVVGLAEPERIQWKVTKDIRANGEWYLESIQPEETRIVLTVNLNPDSANESALDLPMFVSLDSIIDRVLPLVMSEAENVLVRVVEDLEGKRRKPEIKVHETSETIEQLQ